MLAILATIVVGLLAQLVFQSWRDAKLIRELLAANRHLSMLVKAENTTEAQVAIERDRMSQASPEGMQAPSFEEPPAPPRSNSFQVGGRKFTISGINPDQEDEFLRNVIDEVTNAAPIPRA